jgi:protein gp37
VNKQKAPGAIEWTRIRKPDGTVLPGYTWNPVAGCAHHCRWEMPDGTTAICYAETVAERVAQAAYPQGFAHHYWHPARLNEPLRVKTPAGIFLDSMSDLMGIWVPAEQIEQVLNVCREAHWHTFFLLTKNAPRLLKFDFPPNVWVGASIPADQMFGKPLDTWQKRAMLDRTLDVLAQVNAPVRWLSAEPLSWDISQLLYKYLHRKAIQWCVIGAASHGKQLFPPTLEHYRAAVQVLDEYSVPVFLKGNMRSLPYAAERWREEFPR